MNTVTHPIELRSECGFTCDAEVRIEFDYTPFERATRDSPGSPETVDVLAAEVWAKGVKLGNHPAPLKSWEPVIWERIRAERESAEQDRAELMADNY